ncbi:MAG: hypothetical protein AAB632_00315 [Patescibacteria group bacterium]
MNKVSTAQFIIAGVLLLCTMVALICISVITQGNNLVFWIMMVILALTGVNFFFSCASWVKGLEGKGRGSQAGSGENFIVQSGGGG